MRVYQQLPPGRVTVRMSYSLLLLLLAKKAVLFTCERYKKD